MDIELVSGLSGRKQALWAAFMQKMGLAADEAMESTCLVWEDGEIIATGSRQENILKCIAVDPFHQGEDLTATVLTALRQDAFAAGHKHLFLYTKPKNLFMFSSLFFYPIAQTADVLLMEDRPNGVKHFVESLPVSVKGGKIGAAVMNCNPFTRGHRYLIETAAKACDHLYVFVLSEDKSRFSAQDRMMLVKDGTADLPNVTVLPTGPYLISSATFPTYFLKDREKAQTVQCLLDIEVFVKYYVPHFGITHRFVGTEPLSQMTNQYNEALLQFLPKHNIHVVELPRLEQQKGAISASKVRADIDLKNFANVRAMVPATTLRHLIRNNMVNLPSKRNRRTRLRSLRFAAIQNPIALKKKVNIGPRCSHAHVMWQSENQNDSDCSKLMPIKSHFKAFK